MFKKDGEPFLSIIQPLCAVRPFIQRLDNKTHKRYPVGRGRWLYLLPFHGRRFKSKWRDWIVYTHSLL